MAAKYYHERGNFNMSDAWHMSRARNRFKTARDAIGGVPMSDDIGTLTIELLQLLDGVIALLDKRIAKAKDARAGTVRPWLTTILSRAHSRVTTERNTDDEANESHRYSYGGTRFLREFGCIRAGATRQHADCD